MTTICWDAECILLVDLMEHGKTITSVVYSETLNKEEQSKTVAFTKSRIVYVPIYRVVQQYLQVQ